MLKAIALFVVGFVGTVLFLNAITWLFGQAVAAVVAWLVALGALIVIVVSMTAGGVEAPALSDEHETALRAFLHSSKKS